MDGDRRPPAPPLATSCRLFCLAIKSDQTVQILPVLTAHHQSALRALGLWTCRQIIPGLECFGRSPVECRFLVRKPIPSRRPNWALILW